VLAQQLQHKIDNKTKPLGALGLLEKMALQIGTVQKSLSPSLQNPHIVVFAADHGIAEAGVSAYPKAVTHQMVLNFINGGAAINVFAKQHNIQLQIVDAGVDFNFENSDHLVNAKIANGTANFIHSKAITAEQLLLCQQHANSIVDNIAAKNCNIIGFGEMGIGNTSAASMIMHYITKLPLESCTGKGTGVNDLQYQQKVTCLQNAKAFHGELNDAMGILQAVGGFEIAQICFAMLQAAKHNMIILVDGFIATAAYLIADARNNNIQQHALFCHCSNEAGHTAMLKHLNATPILQLDMRLGEGTGCAVAYPIIESAIAFLNNMASFEAAGVSNKN
jgi:nicotinate-nucleotide--dimethylbenzimidazole phosphoribosyltransferase